MSIDEPHVHRIAAQLIYGCLEGATQADLSQLCDSPQNENLPLGICTSRVRAMAPGAEFGDFTAKQGKYRRAVVPASQIDGKYFEGRLAIAKVVSDFVTDVANPFLVVAEKQNDRNFVCRDRVRCGLHTTVCILAPFVPSLPLFSRDFPSEFA